MIPFQPDAETHAKGCYPSTHLHLTVHPASFETALAAASPHPRPFPRWGKGALGTSCTQRDLVDAPLRVLKPIRVWFAAGAAPSQANGPREAIGNGTADFLYLCVIGVTGVISP